MENRHAIITLTKQPQWYRGRLPATVSEQEGETYTSHLPPLSYIIYLLASFPLEVSTTPTGASCLSNLTPIICKAAPLTKDSGLLCARKNNFLSLIPVLSNLAFRPAGNTKQVYGRVSYLLTTSPFSTQWHKGPAKALKLNPENPAGCACAIM